MSNTAEKLRAKARQARFLARQAFSRSRAEALHSLASVYENQAAELECSGSLGLLCTENDSRKLDVCVGSAAHGRL